MLYSCNIVPMLKWSPDPYPPLSTFDAFTERRLKMAELNLKNIQSERSDQENEENNSHSSKKCKELSTDILVKKGQISQEAEEKETTSRVFFFFLVWFFT